MSLLKRNPNVPNSAGIKGRTAYQAMLNIGAQNQWLESYISGTSNKAEITWDISSFVLRHVPVVR
jgi:hypothetical protein